jgi:hypothetical protein
MLLRNVPLIFRRRAGRPRRAAKVAASAALTLESVAFVFVGPGAALTLTFDRAIDIASFDPSQVNVQDPSGTGWAYVGTGVVDTPSPQTVVVEMAQTTPASWFFDSVTASATTGIVAVDDGGTWAGVTNLNLPYP